MKIEINKTVTLKMSWETAIWLRAVMQNPLVEDEAPWEEAAREELFEALEDVK